MKKIIEEPNYSYIFQEDLEKKIKIYSKKHPKYEILGGLAGEISGLKGNTLQFTVSDFLPFPNIAINPRHFAIPPDCWTDILEEWRSFHHQGQQIIGFLHSHPKKANDISEQDIDFGKYLNSRYGTVLFLILMNSQKIKAYVFRNRKFYSIS